jgi:hypothetical protein
MPVDISLCTLTPQQKAIKHTFALSEVPSDAYYLGLAGVLPYLATSLSTFFLAWDIEHAANTGQGFVFSGQKAEALLHLIEPVQIGYGAVVRAPFTSSYNHSSLISP